MSKTHVCEKSRLCLCRIDDSEPHESCPVHGFGENRCDCGRFVARVGYRA